MDLIRSQRGLITWLAPRLRLSQSSISMWQRVPAERAHEIERLTGIPRHLLRPDLWTPPWREGPEAAIPHRRPRIKKTDGDIDQKDSEEAAVA